jgi:hypothetical protein
MGRQQFWLTIFWRQEVVAAELAVVVAVLEVCYKQVITK